MEIPKPKEFLLYYALVTVVAIVLIIRRRRPRGMNLKLEGRTVRDGASLDGHRPPARPARASVERTLNVFFNYNGHSWDAYEVLGLPAGAGPERVRHARDENLVKVDPTSRAFIEAAYRAIEAQWN